MTEATLFHTSGLASPAQFCDWSLTRALTVSPALQCDERLAPKSTRPAYLFFPSWIEHGQMHASEKRGRKCTRPRQSAAPAASPALLRRWRQASSTARSDGSAVHPTHARTKAGLPLARSRKL